MKMASQRFCLRWNNHQSNLLSVFDQLLHAETFTDVTLAVDGQYLKAHKMVLSACSPYFNSLFVNHPEKHPIVILKDVPYSDMKSLLDFMYRGEVSVDQERLTAFLRVAESLRIKGLTEVNDDKPSGVTPTPPPPPPQLQRIQPYLVQQQQQQQQQQRGKGQGLLSSNNNNNNSSSSTNLAQTQQLQQQQSLLSTALAAMPKRKRGRPRKLSGSSNGTGNDYDEYEREGMLNDSELNESKLGNDSFSGNDDASDDNQRESCDNDQDLNESRDSMSQPKKVKQSKDTRPQQQQQQAQSNDNDNNSTSVQLINASPELSQRLFGSSKTTATTTATIGTLVQRQVQPQQPLQQAKGTPDGQEAPIHLPTVLGLKIRVNAQIQQQSNSSANSLLKQQLRSGLKEPEVSRIGSNNSCSNNNSSAHNNDANGHEAYDDLSSNNDSCSALQSLANAAERQAAKASASANAIKPPSANNLHHQFLMHMAANPILKSGGDFFQKQQQQQPNKPPETELNSPSSLIERSAEASSKTESELPASADERRGGQVLVFKSPQRSARGGDRAKNPAKRKGSNGGSARPVQRRRIRRKAQSTLDDQAEHLTEMSVRGLDLFRYASITEGVYQCTECAKENVQKTFKNKYSFQRHAFLYHEGKHRKVFPCPVCGKEFSRPDKMKNHLKMTHESFVSKQDMSTFHPLNYLISAAAAGEIHSSLFSPPQHQQMQQQLDAESDGVGEGLTGSAGTSLGINLQMQKQSADMLELATPADALLKLHNELIIKDEYISPSPSPSPPPTTEAPDFRSPAVVVTQPPTQRLEEVK